MPSMKLGRLVAAVVAGVILAGSQAGIAEACQRPGPPSSSPARELAELRQAAAKFHNVSVAKRDGYAKFTDVNGVTCIAEPGMGAMGVHYVNGTYLSDPTENVTRPEAVVYAPQRNGKQQMVAVEYIVTQAAWNATHTKPPTLFGHTFDYTAAPNRYGLPNFYSLHVWLWDANPAGLYAMWNPRVHCPSS